MKYLLLSVAYVLTLGTSPGLQGGENPLLRQAEEDGRRTLQAAREMVAAELAERIPRLAHAALADARPEPVLPGTLLVKRQERREAAGR